VKILPYCQKQKGSPETFVSVYKV